MGACQGSITKNTSLPSRGLSLSNSQEAAWKTCVKESPTLGKSHYDTEKEYGDILGLKTCVEVTPYIKLIEVFHDGEKIYGYRFYYQYNNYTPQKRHYGWDAHPGVHCEQAVLEPGEYVCEAGGRFGEVCHQLWFKCNTGRVIKFGSDEMGKLQTFDTTKAEKPLIVALGVGMGGQVHHVKVFYLDLNNLPLIPIVPESPVVAQQLP